MLAGEKLSQFILKICAYNPDERYASATEAKKALYEILSEMSSEERSYWVVPPAAADEAEKADDTEKVIDTVILPQFDIANQNEKIQMMSVWIPCCWKFQNRHKRRKKHWTGQSAYSEVC